MPPNRRPNVRAPPPKVSCPFPHCVKKFTRDFTLKQHLLSIKGLNGDEVHPMDDAAWVVAREEGLLTLATRPGNLTDEAKKKRRANASKTFREGHRDELGARRRSRNQELRDAAKLAKRAATIAKKLRATASTAYINNRYRICRNLFNASTELGKGNCNPATILDPTAEVTLDTFPKLVAVYVPLDKWPQFIIADHVEADKEYPIVKQVPGEAEYRFLSSLFHPYKTQQRSDNTGTRGGAPATRLRNNRIQYDDLDQRNPDAVIQPNQILAGMVNDAYALWKDVTCCPALQHETFVYGRHDANAFSAKSSKHEKILHLFDKWVQISVRMMNAIIPYGRSVAQLHHFVHVRPMDPPTEDEDEEDGEDEEEDYIDTMNDDEVLERAGRLVARKKRGRPRKENEDPDGSAEA